MVFLQRLLLVLVGGAFTLALAALFLGPAEEDAAPSFEVASTLPEADPGVLRDLAATLIGAPRAAPGQTAPAAALPPDASFTPSQPLTHVPVSAGPPQVAAAPAPDTAPLALDIDAAWRAWMAAHGLTEGALVVLSPDGTMHRTGLERDTATSVPVASLSKAITGICLDIVLHEHGLGWYTRLGEISDQMSAVRVTPQAWNEHITLASLVTHTSGLAPDLTQGTMGSDLHGALGLHRRIASEALREENIQGTPRTFFYNNTNYAVLGVVIEALTGQSYSEACLDRVVTPAGITDATIHGQMGSRSSYGGWEMSAESYARLAQHWFTAGQPRIDDPASRPMRENYALGYTIHGDGAGAQISHGGMFCHNGGPNLGAYVHARGDGTVIVANWSGRCISAGDTALGTTFADLME
ncbi:serine hydrolase [Hasllibacter sp. MH4015]|uniref:serine hydrolase domain-containing protein n=1 Tax=Hasllibacter sp. MH4015 TaxID=2854029 RepID=UPI001CD52C48|nr:serine hydrolase domain-containing protein [Hasllibacter sp. MH4015]